MNSKTARELVRLGQLTSERAVELLKASDGCTPGARQGDPATCPECGTDYAIDFVTAIVNTCSLACQGQWNSAMLDLDDGRTIVKVSDLTSARLNSELVKVGLLAGPIRLVMS